MTKLQITLTAQEADTLSLKAASIGYNLTRFVKFLLGQKVLEYNEQIPTFRMSKKMEKTVKEAVKDYEGGNTVSVDIDKFGEYFENDK